MEKPKPASPKQTPVEPIINEKKEAPVMEETSPVMNIISVEEFFKEDVEQA